MEKKISIKSSAEVPEQGNEEDQEAPNTSRQLLDKEPVKLKRKKSKWGVYSSDEDEEAG